MKQPLTMDEKVLLADNKEIITASVKVMEMIIERHIEKLVTQSVDDGQTGKLLVLKSRVDGMREMVREYEQLVAKIIRT